MKKILLIFLISLFCVTGCGKNSEDKSENNPNESNEEPIVGPAEIVDIIDVNSNSRPYAIVVNNSPVAIKVQQGLQEAYIVYEVPVEGSLTRLIALYKDIDDLKIGTIRSSRHNFLDYAFEHDAIFVAYGWSHYAYDDTHSTGIEYINGIVHSNPFWRENPENLASEHTAYTNLSKLI